jgi:hypothetical protein
VVEGVPSEWCRLPRTHACNAGARVRASRERSTSFTWRRNTLRAELGAALATTAPVDNPRRIWESRTNSRGVESEGERVWHRCVEERLRLRLAPEVRASANHGVQLSESFPALSVL